MKRRSEVIVGVVILLGAALTFFGTLWLKGAALGREEVVLEARFREVGQLMEGNAVKVRGVPIGRVSEVVLEPGGDAVLVRMRVRADAPIPQDAVVLLSPESMFGDWQAEIHPRGRFPRYDYLESLDPDVLPGYSLPDMSRLTAALDRIAENVAVVSDRFQIAFTEETAVNIREAVENIQQVSEQLTNLIGAQERTMHELSAHLEGTMKALGEAVQTVNRVSRHVESAVASGELTSIVDNMERATAQIDSLSAALLAASRDLRSTMARADTAFHALGSVMAGVEQGQGTLGRLVQDSTLYGDLVRTNTLLQSLLRDFQENPRKYINLRIF
ncbi:MAG TPA: MlaD family protein [Longimicrobiales bacterium]|nr:MlaD family protein [Longimicrobiales bacterium]